MQALVGWIPPAMAGLGNDIELRYMTLKQYVAIMTLATVLCWTAFGFVLVNVDPFEANWVSFIFFYASVFLALLGTLSLLLFGIHRLFKGDLTPLFRSVEKSFRAAALLSAVLTMLLYFQASSWLRVWNVVVLGAALILYWTFALFYRRKTIR